MKKTRKTQLERILLSQFGAHLVCAQLAKRGIIVELVFQNAPGIDAIIYNSETGQSIPIQIKASVEKSFTTYTGTQEDLENKFKLKHWYVFVYVTEEKDRFFIVPGSEVSRLTLEGHLGYVNKHHPRSHKTKEEMAPSRGVHGVRVDQIQKFENQWDSLFQTSFTNDRIDVESHFI
jgi:hypothetical protein